MNANNANTSRADFKVNVKIKLSALWVTVMLLYIYGDIFSMFVPGHIEKLMQGKMGLGTTTPGKLVITSVMMTIPALMVCLSVLLKPALNRWLNIIFGVIYTAIIVLAMLSARDPWWVFYQFLGIVEIIITLLIVWYAWKWPKQ